MSEKKIVLTTAGTRDEAAKIARELVDRRLAACVNVTGPIQSVYRWKGAVESAEEWLLLVKTTGEAIDQVQATIKELHSYELPECVVLPVEGGSQEYLAWLEENVMD
jgi:periplasmic divalent cation tolerance protein